MFKYLEYKKHCSSIYALVGYTILTLFLTYPAFLRIDTHMIGQGDAFAWVGFLSWFDKAIFDLNVNPLYNSYVFYPLGMDIVDTGLVGIILAPVTHIFGSIVSYNIYIFSTFIFAGFGTYLLVKHLIQDKYSSFISGIIFAFSPVHFAHALGHMHIMSVQWLPFFLLYLVKLYESNEKRNIYICSLFFSINALFSWTMAVLALIFGILFTVYVIIKDKNNFANFFKRLIVSIILSAVLILPFVIILIKNMSLNPEMVKPLSNKIIYSADLIGFLIPSPLHPILGNYTTSIYQKFTGNFSENTTYIGYITIVFVVYAFLKVRNRYIGLFLISSLIFFILSLGPVLHVYGRYRFTEQNLTIMLPQMLLNDVPIFSMIRCPSRISVMLMLMLAIICGYGISEFIKKSDGKKKKQILSITILLLILGDFAFTLPSTEIKYPEFYRNISNDSKEYSILELPIGYSPAVPNSGGHLPIYHLYQSIHGKKLAGGALSREGVFFRQFVESSPLQPFWNFNTTGDIYGYNTNSTLSILNYYNIKFVVLHKDLIRENYINSSRLLMKELFGDNHYYEDDQIVVYDVPKNDELFIMLGDGWYGKQISRNDSIPTRWMKNNGVLKIIGTEQSHKTMNFTVEPFYKPRILKIYMNNVLINTSKINERVSLNIPIEIKKGENTLIFYAPEGTDKPSEIIGGEDIRDLSMTFQQISFSTI